MKSLIPWRKKETAVARRAAELDPFEALHRDIDDLFDRFLDRRDEGDRWPALSTRRAWSNLSPSFEVTETDTSVDITAELPGMDEKDIEVTLDENVVSIKGEKKEETERKDKQNLVYSERRYGRFERVVPLSADIDKDRVKASFKKGVLRLTLPKTEDVRKRRKQIQVSTES